jgi:translocation and assembly module TamB
VTRRKILLISSGSAGLLVLLILAGILVLRSGWFHEQLRQALITNVETATGGRAEIGSFRFDWKQMRFEARPFVLHGNEPAGKPPLIRASSVAVGLKIVSFLEQKIDIQYLDVQQPRFYVIVYPDGHTNVPEPRIKRRAERTALDTLFNLAVGRFIVQNGVFEVEGRSRIPFNVRGRNLDTKFLYDQSGPRYQGDVSVQPVELQWDGRTEAPLGIRMSLTIEKNRIGVSSARLTTGNSYVDLAGIIQDMLSPHASFQYDARISAADVKRLVPIRGLERGTADLAGNAEWAGSFKYSVTGNLRVQDGEFRQPSWRVRNVTAQAALRLDEQGVRLGGLRFSGESGTGSTRIPLNGQAAELTVQAAGASARGLSVDALGGRFTGEARLRAGNHFEIRGDLSHLEARRAVAVYNREPLPWNSLVSGHVEAEGSLRQSKDLRLVANLAIAPASGSPPVRGQLAVSYDQQNGALELGHSTLLLPASRMDLNGAIGRQLRVHLETRDLNDFLPALGENTGSLPVHLENGSAVFDGVVSGRTEDPQVTGHLALTRFAYAGKRIDSLQADVAASPGGVRLDNANLALGSARAQFQFSAGLRDWKVVDTSALSGEATLRTAVAGDLLDLFNQKALAVTGTASGSGRISGAVGSPQWSAEIQVVKGMIGDEPFDRIRATLTDTSRRLTVSSGQLTAGAKQVQVAGTFDHELNRYDRGQARFQIQSNLLPLAEFHTLAQSRPGVGGTVQFTASGAFDLQPAPKVAESVRLTELQAAVTARGLQLAGQTIGDANLTANSQDSVLRAHLNTTFNGSSIRGDGEWRMEGGFPGAATVTFTKVDLAGFRAWIAPSPSGAPPPFSGFAEGELRVDGPALKPDLLRAELRLPSLEIRPASAQSAIVLRNAGPIIATAANSVITLEKAELTGPSTDLTLGGTISMTRRNPLDLRVNGRVNLGLLKTFNGDIDASGALTMEASVRGSFATPQINGRVELSNGAMNYGMLPNGITNANGVILFSGDRATIQKLQGSTGGGTVQFSGFAGYNDGGLVFGLHVVTQQVRIRYPEGISSISDASLDLTGTPQRSLLTGNVSIRRATINLQSDVGALLAKSAEPVRTPAAGGGLLSGLNFDVQIETAPDVEIQSALTQGVEADANLRLRGTATNPALLGRVRITQGELVFFGTRYTISQGSISFFNPLKIDPILDVDLETKARGIDVTLTVTGPLNKLTLTPRSDPPLQFNEILSLLTTGEAPGTELTRFGQQAVATQTTQQTAATALLGQAIANPVSGRLQRFFGISRLRINPTLDPALASGVQYTPQARLTLEQQVTPDITFTYITDVSNPNAQIVSVEWTVNKQWSVVAQREENGLIGLDFYLKKRFK